MPILLDSLSEIVLSGTGLEIGVTVGRKRLTCLHEMAGDEILVFRYMRREGLIDQNQLLSTYDLVTTVENFVDTWDGSRVIFDAEAVDRGGSDGIVAIEIGGGTLLPTRDDDIDEMFHFWPGNVSYSHLRRRFSMETTMRIGAPRTNALCPMFMGGAPNESLCWLKVNSRGHIHMLGPQVAYSERDEHQVGVTAGQYVVVQYNVVFRRRPEKTLKETMLALDILPISFIEGNWGVQISFCTGVARRLSLSEMLADIIPAFLNDGIVSGAWLPLLQTHGLLDALRSNTYRGWTQDPLNADVKDLAQRAIKAVLLAIQSTGIERSGDNLVVAWACELGPRSCLKIPCRRSNIWTRILADSVDTATFACMTVSCLETDTQKCQHVQQPQWRQNIDSLNTAVCRATPSANTQFVLEHGKMYCIGRPESYLFARAVHSPNAPPKLHISIGSLSAKMQKRAAKLAVLKGLALDGLLRIRERSLMNIPAEEVLILDAPES